MLVLVLALMPMPMLFMMLTPMLMLTLVLMLVHMLMVVLMFRLLFHGFVTTRHSTRTRSLQDSSESATRKAPREQVWLCQFHII